MNPSLSAKSNPSYLSFSQLKPYCARLHKSVVDADANGQRDKIRYEQQLWAEVKLIRNSKDPNLLTYLIGYYHSILYQIQTRDSPIDDTFQYHILIRLGDLNRYRHCDKVAQYYYSNARNLYPLFGHAYNQLALILAKPEIKPENYYKCCYYYARAAKSSDKSLNTIAETNLRIAVRVYDGDILFNLVNGNTEGPPNGIVGNQDDSGSSEPRKSRKIFDGVPRTAIDWFYVMVIAIYADNIQPVAKLFIDFMRENFSTQSATMLTPRNVNQTSIHCDKDGYLLLASLDIFLDWLKLGSQETVLISLVGGELRKIRACLQSTLASIKYESSTQVNSHELLMSPPSLSPIARPQQSAFDFNDITTSPEATENSETRLGAQNRSSSHLATSLSSSNLSSATNQMALPHDYTMRGFKPLDEVHKSITFCNHKKLVSMINQKVLNQIEVTEKFRNQNNEMCQDGFIDLQQFKQILRRIINKMDGFGSRLKKQTRNIALESILANMNSA